MCLLICQGYILIQWLGCPIRTGDSSLSYKTIWMTFDYSLFRTLSYLWVKMVEGIVETFEERQVEWMQDSILFMVSQIIHKSLIAVCV